MDLPLLDRHLPPGAARRDHPRLHVRPHRAGLHDGLRRAGVHQLRPLGDLRGGRLRGGGDPPRAQAAPGSWTACPGRSCSCSSWWPGMAVSGLLAVTVERVAYRPLRGSPRLIPLISAIGVSFFLQDLVRLVESHLAQRLQPRLPDHRRPRRALRADPDHRHLGEVAGGHRRRAPDPRGPAPGGQPHQDRHGHPRGGRGSGRGQPHGHQRQPDHLPDLPDRRGHGRGGRCPLRRPVRPRQSVHGLHSRAQGLHRRGAGRASATSRAP